MDKATEKRIFETLAKLYDCTCNIYVYEETTDNSTGVSSFKQILKYSDVKCRISYSTGLFQGSSKISAEDDNIISNQYVKLIMPTEFDVPAGSMFEVTTHRGDIYRFKNSGQSDVYRFHQEILAENESEYD
jgi:hypothetical protein